MLLDLEQLPIPMKLVYSLSTELKQDQHRVELAQRLTRDSSKPLLGLKGTHGLFASAEWWTNVWGRRIPLLFVSGIIHRSYVAGQDSGQRINTVELLLEDGSLTSVGIYTNEITDLVLFCPGHLVQVVYALDELKRQPSPDGGINYSKVALEMAVSEKVVAT